jgi:hypothetical protein
MLVTLSEVKSYCKVDNLGIFISDITETLNFKYTGGVTRSITLTPDNYLPVTLAAAIQALMRTAFSDSLITVTWSTTTYKFTIATKAVAQTIQYINADSTAGIYIGFTADSSAAASITSDSVIIDDSTQLDNFRSYADKYIKSYTRRALEAADYSGLYYFDNYILALPDYPINSITAFTTNIQGAIGLSNSSYFITLKYDGTTFTFSDGNTILKSAVTTISELVNAINAVGNGTIATCSNNDYNALSIDTVLEFYPKTVNGLYINIYSYNTVGYDTVEESGIIYLTQRQGKAYASFNAGHATIPEDLKLCALMIIKSMYERWQENAEDQSKYRLNDVYKFYDAIPDKAKTILEFYKRPLC